MPIFSELVIVIGVAALTALMAVVFLVSGRRMPAGNSEPTTAPHSLLFDNGVLHHGTDVALRRFSFFPGTHVWDDLRTVLLPRFPEFPSTGGICASGSMRVFAADGQDAGFVELDWRDGLCWVHIAEGAQQQSPAPETMQNLAAGRCCETLSHPAWETDHDNAVTWCNQAYDLIMSRYPAAKDAFGFDASLSSGSQRLSLSDAHDVKEWFEVTSHPTRMGNMHHATLITPLVLAEEAQRTFVQTLAKTFAHLSIGLAIFDRRGQLGLFNPALVDLTGLQAKFLAAQPTMMSFFDALRENRMMPEPKNYATWRQDISDVIQAASGGQYRETWTLEDGRTYAVQGRPHPDGATAFLIEDISAEVTLSRRFRADMEQFEALLDSIDDALVVFSSAGILTFCNKTYRNMWGHNPDAAFADVTIADAVSLWATKATTKDDWKTATDFSASLGKRADTSFVATMSEGRVLNCHLSLLAADAMLVQFTTGLARGPDNAREKLKVLG